MIDPSDLRWLEALERDLAHQMGEPVPAFASPADLLERVRLADLGARAVYERSLWETVATLEQRTGAGLGPYQFGALVTVGRAELARPGQVRAWILSNDDTGDEPGALGGISPPVLPSPERAREGMQFGTPPVPGYPAELEHHRVRLFRKLEDCDGLAGGPAAVDGEPDGREGDDAEADTRQLARLRDVLGLARLADVGVAARGQTAFCMLPVADLPAAAPPTWGALFELAREGVAEEERLASALGLPAELVRVADLGARDLFGAPLAHVVRAAAPERFEHLGTCIMQGYLADGDLEQASDLLQEVERRMGESDV